MKEALRLLNGGERLTEGNKSILEKKVNKVIKQKYLAITDNIISLKKGNS
jgi:hypothetical protein